MKLKSKLIGLVAALLVSSQGVANADFAYDFAPSQWKYTETTDGAYGPAGTLTASQMQLKSANYTDWANAAPFAPVVPEQKGSYSITIPNNVDQIEFSYQYSTGDITSSYYDMAQYTVGGNSTDLVAIFPQTNVNYASATYGYGAVVSSSGSKIISVKDKQGKVFSIDQLCNDCILGSATVTITGFSVRRITSNSNIVLSDTKPTISADAKSYTCKPGTFAFLQYGVTKVSAAPTSLVYTLILNGTRVSSVSSDNWAGLSKPVFDTSNKAVSGLATAASATWLVDGANTKSAQCEVLAFQDGATALAYSSNS